MSTRRTLRSYRLAQAALADPTIVVPGFETSRVMALIAAVLGNSTTTPKKQLLRAVRTVYLFDVCNKQGDQARWYLDVKVCLSGTRLGGRSQKTREECADAVRAMIGLSCAQTRGRVASLKAEEKAPLKPDVTIKISDRDLVGLATGKVGLESALDPVTALATF